MTGLTDTVHVRAVYNRETPSGDWLIGEECQAMLVTKTNGDGTVNGARFDTAGAISWEFSLPEGVDLSTWHATAACTWGF